MGRNTQILEEIINVLTPPDKSSALAQLEEYFKNEYILNAGDVEFVATSAAREHRASYSGVRQLKQKLADELREYMGTEAIADSARIPSWKGNIMADHEKALCRADRRRG